MRTLVNILAAIGLLALGYVGIIWFAAKDATQPSIHAYTPTSEPACSTSHITIDRLKGRVEGDWIYVAGRIVNNCDTPTGVQIKVTIYDKKDNILTVND